MTVWEKIYQKYRQDGEEYATLQKGLIPEFLDFMEHSEFQEKRVLDIGCGNGKYLVFLKSLGFVTEGLDSSPTAVALTREALGDDSLINLADIYDYELPKDRYDLIISIAAIHHGLKEQVRRAIAQIGPALRSSGYFFVTLPDNGGSAHWTTLSDHEEIEPGTRVPLSGPEKGLPHSSFTEAEIRGMFVGFSELKLQLLPERGRWIISGRK